MVVSGTDGTPFVIVYIDELSHITASTWDLLYERAAFKEVEIGSEEDFIIPIQLALVSELRSRASVRS